MNLNFSGFSLGVIRNLGLHLLLDYAPGYVGQTIFLFIALWIMIKLQKLNCKVIALLGSAALACAIDYIPFVGIYLSVVVLLICITKAIGAKTFTDAIFTTGIAYAVTFCFNLFVLAVLLGDLRLSTRVRARTADLDATNELPTIELASATNSPATTNTPAEPRTSSFPAQGSAIPAPTPAVADAAPAAERVQTVSYSPVAGKMASEISSHFTVHGVSKGPVETSVLISDGNRAYDLVTGDAFQMQTSSGKANVVCRLVDETKVILEVEGVKVVIANKHVY